MRSKGQDEWDTYLESNKKLNREYEYINEIPTTLKKTIKEHDRVLVGTDSVRLLWTMIASERDYCRYRTERNDF